MEQERGMIKLRRDYVPRRKKPFEHSGSYEGRVYRRKRSESLLISRRGVCVKRKLALDEDGQKDLREVSHGGQV